MRGFEPQLLFYSLSRGLKKSKLLSLFCLAILLSACFKYPENAGDGSQEPTDPSVQTDLEKDLEGRQEILPKGDYTLEVKVGYYDDQGTFQLPVINSVKNSAEWTRGFITNFKSDRTDISINYAYATTMYSSVRNSPYVDSYYINGSKIKSDICFFEDAFGLSTGILDVTPYSGKEIERYALFVDAAGDRSYLKLPSIIVNVVN